jgi:oxygen-independent coproporphyrinogen-3 oxidase
MLGLYFHIPFCLKKCNYCDFISFSDFNEEIIEKYIDVLIFEIELKAEMFDLKNQNFQNQKVASILGSA